MQEKDAISLTLMELPAPSLFIENVADPLILFVLPGAEIDEASVEAHGRTLLEDPTRVAWIDLPTDAHAYALGLDLLLRPEHVTAVLVRTDLLRKASTHLSPSDPFALASLAVELLRSFPAERCNTSLAKGSTTLPSDRSVYVEPTLRAFAFEDLYPILRQPRSQTRLPSAIQDCASRLQKLNATNAAAALRDWADALLGGTDRGMGLDFGTSAGSTPQISESPAISVIIPTKNRPRLLARALHSLEKQTFQDFEIIIVNDGGDKPVSANGPRTTVIHSGSSRGPSGARNMGLRLARGKYIGFLDDDDRLLPHHFQTLISVLNAGNRIAFTDSRVLMENETDDLPVASGIAPPFQETYDPMRFALENRIPIQAVLFERALLDETDGFDESLRVLEDWELWLRLFALATPIHISRVTSEVRSRTEGGHALADHPDLFPQARGEIYGRTLQLEEMTPGLREKRVEHLHRLAQKHGQAFPQSARVWLQGNAKLPTIQGYR